MTYKFGSKVPKSKGDILARTGRTDFGQKRHAFLASVFADPSVPSIFASSNQNTRNFGNHGRTAGTDVQKITLTTPIVVES